ncbi:MAG: hypothetical protein ABSD59_15175 [Terracidiphilus sp.]|jgi:hypothetical protein
MKRIATVVLYCLALSTTAAIAQSNPPNLSAASNGVPANLEAMKSAYASSGSIVVLDRSTIVIEPKMPAPLCALPKNQDGKITWSFYTFPLASIRVPLAEVDETLISEDRVFSSPDAPRTYKPGDPGDTTMVVVAVIPGKQFHTLIYDLDKFTHLGPGPHSSKEYGQTPDDTEAFGLTFADPAAARIFALALKNAVILAKAQAALAQHP